MTPTSISFIMLIRQEARRLVPPLPLRFLYSARSWDEGVIGYAAVGDMCGRNPATAVNVVIFIFDLQSTDLIKNKTVQIKI